MRAWRTGREVAKPKTLKDRMAQVCRQCSSSLYRAFNDDQGRHYDLTWEAQFGITPRIERRGHRLDIYVTPAWTKKVGENRAVIFPNTKHRTFIYDSEPIADSEMSARSVRCMMLKGVGVMKKHYYESEVTRLMHRYDDLNTNDNLSYVDAYKEFNSGNVNSTIKMNDEIYCILFDSQKLVNAFKQGDPYEYSIYYLEHETLNLQSVGHTMLHAKNLLNRRLKKATLDALI